MTIGSRRRITRETLFTVIPEYAGAVSKEAAERMFERDKREILDLGLALETEVDPWDETVVHYRIIRDDARLPSLDVTPAEYTVLLAASRAWDDAAAGGAARRVRAKLLSLGQEPDRELVRRTPRANLESLPVLTPLLEAVTAGQQVVFRYRGTRGGSTERHVEPWVVGVHAGHWYVLGHDLDRGEQRIFRASRIESFPRRRGARTHPVPSSVSLSVAMTRADAWSQERAEVVLDIEPFKALAVRDAAGADPGTRRVQRSDLPREEALRLVRAHSRWITLQEPEAWRADLGDDLARVAALHEGRSEPDLVQRAPVRERVSIRTSSTSTDHLSRLIAEAAYVLSRGEARLEEMAGEFGITVDRLIEDLQILFVCGDLGTGWEDFIDAEWESGWVRVRNADALGGPLRLTPPEATALLAGLAALDPATGEERDLVASARGKLRQLVAGGPDAGHETEAAQEPDAGHEPEAMGAAAEPAAGNRQAPGEERTQTIVSGIQQALADGEDLVIRYSPPDRPGTSVRRIAPRLLESRGGRAYLRALDAETGAERTFRIDRIVELPGPDADVSSPPEEAMESAVGPVEEVWLRLEPAGTWIAEAFEAAELRDPPGAEGVLARLTDPVLPALLDAVIEAAGEAEVLSPPEIRDRIVTMAREAAARHRGPERIG